MDPDARFEEYPEGGVEVLVLRGSATHDGAALSQGAWLRLPAGAPLRLDAGAQGVAFWKKTGHLPFAAAPKL